MIEDKVKEVIEPSLTEANLKILKIEYVKEENQNILRVFIDTDNIETCVKATKIINPILDEYDLINEQYNLEVSSRGIGDEEDGF
jgi:ribosome maturation factor RimP